MLKYVIYDICILCQIPTFKTETLREKFGQVPALITVIILMKSVSAHPV